MKVRTTRPVVAASFSLAVLLSACGGSGADSSPSAAASEETSPTATAGSPESTGGEARGTIEIDGQAFDVTLGDAPTAQCTVAEDAATVVYMTSPEGVRVDLGTVARIWQATVFDANGQQWKVSNDQPPAGAEEPRIELTDGRAVVDGTWGAADGSGQTLPIRVELFCPSSAN